MPPHTFEDVHKLKEEVKKEVMSELTTELSAIKRGQDEINKSLFATNQKLDSFLKDFGPQLKWFKDYEGFRNIVMPTLKLLGLIGAAFTGLGLAIKYLFKIGQ